MLMKKKEFKEEIKKLLGNEISGLSSWEEKISYLRQIIIELDSKHEHEESNKGKSWTDDEIRLILQISPTKENILKLARAFKRGYGSIEQIYRWASEDKKTIQEKRPDDSFILQIKRVATEIGWRAT
jgi:predicted secreted protein